MKFIPLPQGKQAIVDDEDFESLSKHRWSAQWGQGTYYAVRDTINGRIYMHRVVINAPDGKDVDHKNRNGLDNRRDNLRACSRSENMLNNGLRKDNKTGIKGVTKRGEKFQVYLGVDGRRKCLGTYGTIVEAKDAYRKGIEKYFGKENSLIATKE